MKNIRKQLKHVVLLAALTLVGLPVLAQSDVLLNQQWFSRLNRNPAAAGLDKDNVNVGLFYRSQWNLDDALRSGVLNVDSYVDSWKSNIGLSMMYDQPGPAHKNLTVNLAYAYRFNISEKFQLSLGLAGGMSNISTNFSKLTVDNGSDPGLPTKNESSTNVDFGFGTELTTDKLTIGLSMTHLGNNTSGTFEKWRPANQVYAYGRYMIPAGTQIDIAPSLGYVHYDNGNLFELGVTGFLQKKYWAGVSWRPDAAMVFLLGLDFSMFSVGYAYDAALGDSRDIGGGSHEIFLRARISKGKK